MARGLKAFVLLVGFGAFAQAQALPVTFEFNGSCDRNCYGLIGPTITGAIGTTDDLLADGTLAGAEISDFWLDFGLFTLNNSNASLRSTSLTLSDDGQSFSSGFFRIDGVFGILPGSALDFVANEGSNRWSFVVPFIGDPAGRGGFSRVPTAVPEPATLSLLGAGFLAIGWARRRRRTGR